MLGLNGRKKKKMFAIFLRNKMLCIYRHENGSGVKKVRRIGAQGGVGAGDFHEHRCRALYDNL